MMYKVIIEGGNLKEPMILEYEHIALTCERGLNTVYPSGANSFGRPANLESIAPNFREIPKQSCYECTHFSPRTLSPNVCLKHPVVYQNIQPTTVTCDDWLSLNEQIHLIVSKSSQDGIDIMVNALEKIKDCPMLRDEMIGEATHALYCVNNSVVPSDNTRAKFNFS